MRLQRGRHEVKLMVRYPREERQSRASFEDIRVRTGNGAERPLTELADVTIQRGYSQINRLDQKRSITVTADVDERIGNADDIVGALKDENDGFITQLLKRPEYEGISVRWEGQQEQTKESMGGLTRGLAIALVVMFCIVDSGVSFLRSTAVDTPDHPLRSRGSDRRTHFDGNASVAVQRVRDRRPDRRGCQRLHCAGRLHQPPRTRRNTAARGPGGCRHTTVPPGAVDVADYNRRAVADSAGNVLPGPVSDPHGHQSEFWSPLCHPAGLEYWYRCSTASTTG